MDVLKFTRASLRARSLPSKVFYHVRLAMICASGIGQLALALYCYFIGAWASVILNAVRALVYVAQAFYRRWWCLHWDALHDGSSRPLLFRHARFISTAYWVALVSQAVARVPTANVEISYVYSITRCSVMALVVFAIMYRPGAEQDRLKTSIVSNGIAAGLGFTESLITWLLGYPEFAAGTLPIAVFMGLIGLACYYGKHKLTVAYLKVTEHVETSVFGDSTAWSSSFELATVGSVASGAMDAGAARPFAVALPSLEQNLYASPLFVGGHMEGVAGPTGDFDAVGKSDDHASSRKLSVSEDMLSARIVESKEEMQRGVTKRASLIAADDFIRGQMFTIDKVYICCIEAGAFATILMAIEAAVALSVPSLVWCPPTSLPASTHSMWQAVLDFFG